MTRKFTTGADLDVSESGNLIAEMPERIQKFMQLKPGQFQHEVHKNGAVIIRPDNPDLPDEQQP